MLKFDLVIFDLDGTLIDSQQDLSTAVNLTRSFYGLPTISVDRVRSFVGDGVKNLMSRSLPEMSAAETEAATHRFRAFYDEHLLDQTRLYPGAKEVLQSLKDAKIAVVTNKPEGLANKIIASLLPGIRFETISGGDSGPRRKPDPQPLNDIVRKLKIQKAKCIMIGDGKNDILAAKAAGIRCVSAEYGYTAPAELRALAPYRSIKNIKELKNILFD